MPSEIGTYGEFLSFYHSHSTLAVNLSKWSGLLNMHMARLSHSELPALFIKHLCNVPKYIRAGLSFVFLCCYPSTDTGDAESWV